MGQVCRALGVRPGQQAAGVAEQLVGRLRRLDEVLPRYQLVVTQLYDLLRVGALDEVVPAVVSCRWLLAPSQRGWEDRQPSRPQWMRSQRASFAGGCLYMGWKGWILSVCVRLINTPVKQFVALHQVARRTPLVVWEVASRELIEPRRAPAALWPERHSSCK
jgi:hypothetical protein